MALRLLAHIDLPEHGGAGGFDHADVHSSSDRLYVAHTSNDALDVIDIARDQYIESMPGLTAAAGVLVSEARGLVFTSNPAALLPRSSGSNTRLKMLLSKPT